ncbi:MAG: hypothetical protein R3B82_14120 [Sandaracinaceae bacterium]
MPTKPAVMVVPAQSTTRAFAGAAAVPTETMRPSRMTMVAFSIRSPPRQHGATDEREVSGASC